LRRFGYFPNAELSEQYPSWQPFVKEAPAQPDVVDGNMQAALRELQRNLGLPVTGTLTADTLAAMQQERCGVPDGEVSASRVDKFALQGASNRWTKTNITFRFATAGGLGALTQNQVRAAISNGIHAWEANTNLTFSEVTSGGDFAITFHNMDGPGNILARGGAPPAPAMEFDSSESWSLLPLVAVAQHEAGHLIGLDHSSFGDSALGFPVMHPINHNVTTFTDDDNMGANAVYNGWEQIPGVAIDIGVNSIAGTTGDVVWVVGNDNIPYRWNGSGWIQTGGVSANRIDVDAQGHGVVVATDGRILRHQFSTPAWVELPGGGRAKDVGVAQNGAIWVIGLDNLAYNFNPGNGTWTGNGGPAGQIAIDVTPTGQPWVVTSNNELWVGPAPWAKHSTGIGSDVGLGGKNNGPGTREWLFVIAQNSAPYVLDRQEALSVSFPCGTSLCSSTAPLTNTWVPMGGIATRVAAGSRGRSWLVTSSGQIFRRMEMP
jgi:hypothetical protein